MPRRFKRSKSKKTARRGRTRQRKGKSSKFTSKVPRSIKGFKQLSFPSVLKRSLRVCYTLSLTPEYHSDSKRWVGSLSFKCNGVNPPAATPSLADPRVPMDLDEYARIYTSYRVNSSKIHTRFFASPLKEDFVQSIPTGPGTSEAVNTGPAYITVRRRQSLSDADSMDFFTMTDCRENGFRFIKIDPSQSTGAATGTWSGIGGRDYAHAQNGTSMTTGYQAKYAKQVAGEVLGVHPRQLLDPHSSSITGDPTLLQYFQILLVQPDENQAVGGVAATMGSLAPTPVQCQITIIYNMSFWRKRTLKPRSTQSEVSAAAAAGGQP